MNENDDNNDDDNETWPAKCPIYTPLFKFYLSIYSLTLIYLSKFVVTSIKLKNIRTSYLQIIFVKSNVLRFINKSKCTAIHY